MESGSIVEYIDRQKIMCAVVLEVKNQRLRLLTENNREVNLSHRRLLHKDKTCLDSALSRDQMVEALKEIVQKRQALIKNIDIKELWEVLNSEQNWIDLATMTEFCFPDSPSGDHESAVIRALFNDRLYFKFNPDGFFPNSEKRVEQIVAQRKAEERKKRLIESGSAWLKSMLNSPESADLQMLSDEIRQSIDILKSYYLFEKDSKDNEIARAMIARAAIENIHDIFQIFAAVGIFDEDENIELLRFDLSPEFTETVAAHAAQVVRSNSTVSVDGSRKALTHLPLVTIDGQGTLDFDDAISIEETGDSFRLGVHIVVVVHFI
jgi:exoribonuclease-2